MEQNGVVLRGCGAKWGCVERILPMENRLRKRYLHAHSFFFSLGVTVQYVSTRGVLIKTLKIPMILFGLKM